MALTDQERIAALEARCDAMQKKLDELSFLANFTERSRQRDNEARFDREIAESDRRLEEIRMMAVPNLR